MGQREEGRAGIGAGRMPTKAELSSLATTAEELSRRVTAIADSCARDKREDLAAELYQAERALVSAQRALTRVMGWVSG